MTAQTAGRVFRLAERFVRASGTAIRLLVPLKSDSAGLMRLLTATNSLWITEVMRTAKRIDWPPERRKLHSEDSSSTQTALQRMLNAIPPARTPERQRNQNPTAPSEKSHQNRTPYDSDNTRANRAQLQTEPRTADLADAPTKPEPQKDERAQARSKLDQCLNKPLSPPPLSQNECRQSCVNLPRGATSNTGAKATPPRENAAPTNQPTQERSRSHEIVMEGSQTNRCLNKSPPSLTSQDERRQNTGSLPLKATRNTNAKGTPPPWKY